MPTHSVKSSTTIFSSCSDTCTRGLENAPSRSKSPRPRRLLLEKGVSPEFGARELKRTIHRMLTQPLAGLVADGRIEPGVRLIVDLADEGQALSLQAQPKAVAPEVEAARPVVLAVDDNPHLLEWLQHVVTGAGVTALAAANAQQARDIAADERLDLVLLDLLLPDGDGLQVAFELLRMSPRLQIVLMSGTELSPDEAALCERQDFPVLRKPFLAIDVVSVIHARLLHSAAAGR